MNFGWALEQLKNGSNVRRDSWVSTNFIFIVPRSKCSGTVRSESGAAHFVHEYEPHIVMKTNQETIVIWSASPADLLAEDWKILGCDFEEFNKKECAGSASSDSKI